MGPKARQVRAFFYCLGTRPTIYREGKSMPLEDVVESLEKVPQPYRTLYVEKDGKFNLDMGRIEDTVALKASIEKERKAARDSDAARKAVEAKYEAKYAGIDPDEVRAMQAKFGADEEGQLIKAGKIEEVVAKRTEKQRLAQEKELQARDAKVEAAEGRAKKFSQRALDDRVKDAVIGKVHDTAIKGGDVMRAAREIFTLNEDGDAVQMDKDGNVVLGKDGKTSFGPAEWIESMREINPHWFPNQNSGGGASGDRGARGNSSAIKRAAFDAKSVDERTKFIKGGGTVVD